MKKVMFVLILFLFVSSVVYAANELEDSLILYMSFDTVDGKETVDHSIYGNHGEMQGNPKLVKGRFGKALQLNGEDEYVEIPHHEALTVTKEVTVMAWINIGRHSGLVGSIGKG